MGCASFFFFEINLLLKENTSGDKRYNIDEKAKSENVIRD